MTDTPETSGSQPIPAKFRLTLDMRDVIGGGGVLLVFAGLATVHWGLAVSAAGAGLFVLGLRLAR